MKKTFNHTRITFFLVSAFVFLGINFGTAAQDVNRQRIAEKPTPTPRSTATPTPTVSPTVVSTPSATPVPLQTLGDLQSRIRLALSRPELRRGTVAIKIAALDTGKTIFEESADKYVMPASNMKNFTVATALERLSPNFRFATSVYADSAADSTGTIKGDLRIYGRGDVSLSSAFYEGDYLKGLDMLADKIVQAGVKRVEGNLVGDESYFSGNPIPPSWEWDDLQWRSGAEVSALPLNDNVIELNVKPGSTVGSACFVQFNPANSVMRIVNSCTTSNSSLKRDLIVKKALEQNILEISGTMPAGDRGFSNALTISHPAELFVALLKQRLQEKGVIITGQTRVVGAEEKTVSQATSSVQPVEITKLESPPFSLIAAKTMKPSQNLYTETILWTLGEQFGDRTNPKSTSAERGAGVVKSFLQQIGIPNDAIVQWDGSGLSRHNLVTANSVVQLYTYMAKQSRYAQAWRDSLTIGGIDGTLQNRFKNTSAAGNVRGKTGTIDQVSALSGYVTTAAGEPLVFSIIVNGVPSSATRTATIDEIVVGLANFNGKIN